MNIMIISNGFIYKNQNFNIENTVLINEIEDAKNACNLLVSKSKDLIVMLDEYGIGATIISNKIKGIVCARILDEFTAYYTKLHNNPNFIIIPTEIVSENYIKILIDKFLNTNFEGGRHNERLKMLNNTEELEK